MAQFIDLYYSRDHSSYYYVVELLRKEGFKIELLYEYRLQEDKDWYSEGKAVIRVSQKKFTDAANFLVKKKVLIKKRDKQAELNAKIENFFTGKKYKREIFEYFSKEYLGIETFYSMFNKTSNYKIQNINSTSLSSITNETLSKVKFVYCNKFDNQAKNYFSVDVGIIFGFAGGSFITWLFEEGNSKSIQKYKLEVQNSITKIINEYHVVDVSNLKIWNKLINAKDIKFNFFGQKIGKEIVPTDLEISNQLKRVRVCTIEEPIEKDCQLINLEISNNWMIVLEDKFCELAKFRIKK